MKSRALFIASHERQAKMARSLANNFDFIVDIYSGGLLRGGAQYACEHQDRYDVIISQVGMRAHLEKIIDKPIISPVQPLNVLIDTVVRAAQYGAPILFVCYNANEMKSLALVTSVMNNLECRFMTYLSKEELEYNVKSLPDFIDYTVISDGSCVQKYLGRGARCDNRFQVLETTREMMTESFRKAQSIIDVKQAEAKKNNHISRIKDNAVDGVIVLDKNACIKDANARSAQLSMLAVEELTGRNILDKTLPPLFRTIYGDSSNTVGQLVKCQNQEFLVNRVSIHVTGDHDETLITFRKTRAGGAVDTPETPWQERGLVALYTFDDIQGVSHSAREAIKRARRFGTTDAPILVEGETGTGKELFVQSIHNASERRKGPFVVVNCAALPESLLESELFGYEDGAFTGARKGGKRGLFELANNGTIFLDEVSESSMAIQSRLLRVLQEKEVMRVGGQSVLRTNVRVIAATNKDLSSLVEKGTFKDDLYFRLCRLKLTLPPLRDRKDDIFPLFRHFVQQSSSPHKGELLKNPEATASLLQAYNWPGNIRELSHVVESLVVLYDPPQSVQEALHELLGDSRVKRRDQDDGVLSVPIGSLKDMQRDIAHKVLQRFAGNKTRVADVLDISRGTVWKLLK